MITLTREEAQQVLAALCQSSQPASGYRRNELHLTPKPHFELYNEAIETLRARLSQPESEPVAWTVGGLITDFSRDFSAYKTKTYTRPLYTAPPQRERVQFPTMLRKMWSGTEVQAWLDENVNQENNNE